MTRSQVGQARAISGPRMSRFRLFGAGIAGLALVSAGLVAAAPPASAATANPAPAAGARHNATRLPFTVSGTSNLSVDVGTGNALFSDQLLTLPGVTADIPVALSFNQSLLFSQVPSAVTGTTGSGWSITGFDQRLVANTIVVVSLVKERKGSP